MSKPKYSRRQRAHAIGMCLLHAARAFPDIARVITWLGVAKRVIQNDGLDRL